MVTPCQKNPPHTFLSPNLLSAETTRECMILLRNTFVAFFIEAVPRNEGNSRGSLKRKETVLILLSTRRDEQNQEVAESFSFFLFCPDKVRNLTALKMAATPTPELLSNATKCRAESGQCCPVRPIIFLFLSPILYVLFVGDRNKRAWLLSAWDAPSRAYCDACMHYRAFCPCLMRTYFRPRKMMLFSAWSHLPFRTISFFVCVYDPYLFFFFACKQEGSFLPARNK